MGVKKVSGKLDDWDSGDIGVSNFLKLEEGENEVRIIDSPYQFYIHWPEDASGAKRRIQCSEKGCPLCQKGDKAQARWYIPVFSLKNKKCMILEIGPQIYKDIRSLNSNKSWGNPRKYNVNILRQPKGSQPLYKAMPLPPTPMEAEHKVMIQVFLEETDILEMIKPPAPEEVLDKLGISSGGGGSATSGGSGGDTDTEDDFGF